jgi:hypothetical protein
LKLARNYGWLVPNADQSDYVVSKDGPEPANKKKKKGKPEAETIVEEQKSGGSWVQFLEDMITNEDRHIVLGAFRTITDPRKDSLPIVGFEFRLVKKFLLYNSKNRFPDFRNDSANAIKKFIHRCRNVFNPEISLIDEDPKNLSKICGESANFRHFYKFMNDVYNIFMVMVYPESPYESTHPLLELLRVIYEAFGVHDFLFRKKTLYMGSQFLDYCNFYSQDMFEQLLNNFRSSWDTSRDLSYDVLRYFPKDLPYLDDLYRENIINEQARILVHSPQLRDIEAGGFGISFLFERQSSLDLKLTYLENLVEELIFKRKLMEGSFLKDLDVFKQNLYHGVLSAVGNIISNIDLILEMIGFDKMRVKKIFSNLFREVAEAITFAQGIISASDTPVLLATAQSDKHAPEPNKLGDRYGAEQEAILSKLATGNTLMDSFNNPNVSAEDMNNENLIVVSFYLISKQSGILFEQFCSLIIYLQVTKESANKIREPVEGVFDYEDVKNLIQSFTEALLMFKHRGAVNKIANGLSLVCKGFNEMIDPKFTELAFELLERILNSVQNSDFKSITRRSAGLPYAIVALLKSEPAGLRHTLLPFAMDKLKVWSVSDDPNLLEIRIHSLNILNRVFQDSSLKLDMQHYLGAGLMTAIVGFSHNDWSVRNSSLALYSGIIRRMFDMKDEDQLSIRNSLNIVQFFLRAPNLINFFFDEVNSYLENEVKQQNMYPTLYPIC